MRVCHAFTANSGAGVACEWTLFIFEEAWCGCVVLSLYSGAGVACEWTFFIFAAGCLVRVCQTYTVDAGAGVSPPPNTADWFSSKPRECS